jgi:hypothetical protein
VNQVVNIDFNGWESLIDNQRMFLGLEMKIFQVPAGAFAAGLALLINLEKFFCVQFVTWE